jgi:DNA end-binding protein Ku
MSARAIWKGRIQLDGVAVPVKLYSAVQDHQIRFHLLHGPDGSRIRQRMINPESGQEVHTSETLKGYPIEKGHFVVFKPQELAALEPKPSRDIEITRFVPAGTIDPQWYDRPYYLGPDGPAEPYFALAEALRHKKREGVARWVMRKRRYAGAIRAHGDHLLLFALRDPAEVIDVSKLETPSGRAMDARELALAEQLVSALAGDFDPKEFQDDYRERVLELIEAKAKGKTLQLKPLRKRKPTSDALTGVLQASLKQLKERASA